MTGFTVRFQNIDMTIPKQKAEDDMKVPGSILYRFINELNLVSAGPVARPPTQRESEAIIF
jgi:hypothetical protein